MKNLIALLAILAIITLSACGSSEKPEIDLGAVSADVEEETKIENSAKEVDKENESIDEDPDVGLKEGSVADFESKPEAEISPTQVQEILEYSAIGEGDKVVSVSVENGEIKAVIELLPHDRISAKDLAVSSYSQASDALLDEDGWDQLTIEYVGIGKASMNRSEKETNEYDMDYFPTITIIERLK
ncbi:hypothetical protein EBB07_31415 [Paenibacillaceae bacterium]|nr:hypothetical protein EBB07_31415 [Paenibacillaceae bacterium]